jgi:GNAT superfamily N-acetyltransferase
VYIATVNDEIAGFLSVLHFPHPKSKNIKKVHRLVILPDYQGAGIGIKFLNNVGEIYKKANYRYSIVTSAPSLINSLKNQTQWICKSIQRFLYQNKTAMKSMKSSDSHNRITASFEFKTAK